MLYAMWFFHLRMFPGSGLVAWIGLLVVVQNILASLFNSHLFDFHEGWMYILGVGIAGGTINAKARLDGRQEAVLQLLRYLTSLVRRFAQCCVLSRVGCKTRSSRWGSMRAL